MKGLFIVNLCAVDVQSTLVKKILIYGSDLVTLRSCLSSTNLHQTSSGINT